MIAGEADVVVTDGFTGNVVIKLGEAIASYFMQVIREEIIGPNRWRKWAQRWPAPRSAAAGQTSG